MALTFRLLERSPHTLYCTICGNRYKTFNDKGMCHDGFDLRKAKDDFVYWLPLDTKVKELYNEPIGSIIVETLRETHSWTLFTSNVLTYIRQMKLNPKSYIINGIRILIDAPICDRSTVFYVRQFDLTTTRQCEVSCVVSEDDQIERYYYDWNKGQRVIDVETNIPLLSFTSCQLQRLYIHIFVTIISSY